MNKYPHSDNYGNLSTRFFSKQQENKVAKALGGYRQANSGATPFRKGDVVTEQFLIECKTHMKPMKSMTIKEEWLYKLREEAFAMGKNAYALCFDFNQSDNLRYYVIPERLFIELLHHIEG